MSMHAKTAAPLTRPPTQMWSGLAEGRPDSLHGYSLTAWRGILDGMLESADDDWVLARHATCRNTPGWLVVRRVVLSPWFVPAPTIPKKS